MIAAPFRGRAGFAHQPEIPPTVSASKVTSGGAATRSMTASNGPRAAVPASLPLKAATPARRAVAPRASSGLSGWTVSQGGFAAISHTHFRGQLDQHEGAVLIGPDTEISVHRSSHGGWVRIADARGSPRYRTCLRETGRSEFF